MTNKIRLRLLTAALAFLSPAFSQAQSGQVPAERNLAMHHETMGDSYVPNAWQNKRASPAYKSTVNRGSNTRGTGIYTTQVNVNSSGQNILGDAANEPNIAVDPLDENKIVIGWRQFDNVASNFRQAGWSYTSDGGLTWTFPGEIQSGLFRSDPVLDYDSAGNFYYNSLRSNFTTQIFKSTNGGATWDNGTPAGGGDKQWMTIDRTAGAGSGNIYSFWSSDYSTCPPGFFTRSTNDDTSYENCTEVDGSPFWGSLAVGNAGELYIAGADFVSDSILIAKSLNAQTPGSLITWSASTAYMDGYINSGLNVNPDGLLGQVSIDVDRSNGPGEGNVYILAAMTRISNSDPGDVMFSKSTDGGLTWSSPMRINDDASVSNTQWLATMSVAPNGRIDAAWLDTRNAPGTDSSALYYSYSTDEGTTWSANEKLSDSFNPHIGYPNQNKMGDYFDMVSDNTGAHLAWANTLNGEEDVYYSHITPEIATSVSSVSNEPSFSVFPNPVASTFTITNNGKQSQLGIYNEVGEKIYTATILKTKTEIDLSAQPAGVYFLQLIDQEGRFAVKKIVKE